MPFPWQPGHRITAERLRYGIQSGVAVVEFSTGSTSVAAASSPWDVAVNKKVVTVTFAEPFETAPTVVAVPESGSPEVMLSCTVSGITTTGFTITGMRTNTVDTNVHWTATD